MNIPRLDIKNIHNSTSMSTSSSQSNKKMLRSTATPQMTPFSSGEEVCKPVQPEEFNEKFESFYPTKIQERDELVFLPNDVSPMATGRSETDVIDGLIRKTSELSNLLSSRSRDLGIISTLLGRSHQSDVSSSSEKSILNTAVGSEQIRKEAEKNRMNIIQSSPRRMRDILDGEVSTRSTIRPNRLSTRTSAVVTVPTEEPYVYSPRADVNSIHSPRPEVNLIHSPRAIISRSGQSHLTQSQLNQSNSRSVSRSASRSVSRSQSRMQSPRAEEVWVHEPEVEYPYSRPQSDRWTPRREDFVDVQDYPMYHSPRYMSPRASPRVSPFVLNWRMNRR